MKQATLGDTAGEEGGGEADAGREPGGSDPETTFPYPDLGHIVDSRDPGDEFEWIPHSERDEGPNLGGGPWGPCPVCEAWSDKSYACSECGKLFDGGQTHGAARDTAVGG